MADADHREIAEIDDRAREPILVRVFRLPVVEMDGGGLTHRRVDVGIAVLAAGERQIGRRAEHGGAVRDRTFGDGVVELAGVDQHVERPALRRVLHHERIDRGWLGR